MDPEYGRQNVRNSDHTANLVHKNHINLVEAFKSQSQGDFAKSFQYMLTKIRCIQQSLGLLDQFMGHLEQMQPQTSFVLREQREVLPKQIIDSIGQNDQKKLNGNQYTEREKQLLMMAINKYFINFLIKEFPNLSKNRKRKFGLKKRITNLKRL